MLYALNQKLTMKEDSHPSLPLFALFLLFFLTFFLCTPFSSLEASSESSFEFPRATKDYHDSHLYDICSVLHNRIDKEPFNLAASAIFLFAIIHTLCGNMIKKFSKCLEERHTEKVASQFVDEEESLEHEAPLVSFAAEIIYFLGEIEVIFGIWVIPLAICITLFFSWDTAVQYINNVAFTEPLFVIVIMTLAETRPMLKLVENSLHFIARFGKNSVTAWWLTLLTLTPLLGSFITEPAAMTIAAFLLAKQFYDHNPSSRFAYATLGLLFVNISVGGVLTHFASPPVLMVAGKWNWDTPFMMTHFGWKAVIGISTANFFYYLLFRKELSQMEDKRKHERKEAEERPPVPVWITCVHIVLLAWVVINAHNPAIFLGSFFLFIGFHKATRHYQDPIQLKTPMLVGFFLSGLVIHGGLQKWWLSPILEKVDPSSLMGAAVVLTAFNDNAIVTYLTTTVPSFNDTLKYAVVAGAVTGGGLTVIANAPNPVGQLVLKDYFGGSISPLRLFLGAALPTIILSACFLFL